LALHEDGHIDVWGYNGSSLLSSPTGTNFIDIAAWGDHAFGLTADGKIVFWGNDGSQVYGINEVPYDLIGDNEIFTSISTGQWHALGVVDTVVPEPATIALFTIGGILLRKRKNYTL
jgi:hypothetical protein